MKFQITCLLAAVISAAIMAPDSVQAQAPNKTDPFGKSDLNRPSSEVSAANSPYQIKQYQPAAGSRSMIIEKRLKGNNTAAPIRAAAEAVRDAKDDDEKAAAQKNLTELLSKYYDDDMVQREGELKQIEERLVKLRELLDRRRAKKQEIIDLQTKVALNEAEGLGFYDAERPKKYSDLQRVDDLFSSPVPVGPPLTPAVAAPPKPPKTPTPPRDSR